jgi:hypothetical protein
VPSCFISILLTSCEGNVSYYGHQIYGHSCFAKTYKCNNYFCFIWFMDVQRKHWHVYFGYQLNFTKAWEVNETTNLSMAQQLQSLFEKVKTHWGWTTFHQKRWCIMNIIICNKLKSWWYSLAIIYTSKKL